MRVFALLALSSALAVGQTTSLASLVTEAEVHNPALAAATAAWRAAAAEVSPAGALPDPEVSLQQMSVGNPLPFAGYRSSNFAYLGVGASQSLPYPGKLGLRRSVAASRAAASEAELAADRRALRQQVQAAYVEIGYLAQERILLQRQQALLDAIERQTELRYGSATGAQSEVLAAQLEQSRLLRELAQQSEREAVAQARMRALLDRPPDTPAVVAEPLRPTRLSAGEATLQAALRAAPDQQATAARITGARQAVALARKDFKPDFNLQYMYQRTGNNFPDYYQWTVGINLPLHRKARLEPELEHAAQAQLEAEATARAQARQDEVQLTDWLDQVDLDQRLLTLDQGALLPQARATAAARLAEYGADRGTLAAVLAAEGEALTLEQQYWQTLADHETTLGKITALTGVAHD